MAAYAWLLAASLALAATDADARPERVASLNLCTDELLLLLADALRSRLEADGGLTDLGQHGLPGRRDPVRLWRVEP